MTKWLDDLPIECEDLLELLRMDAIPSMRELLPVSALLMEARALVLDEAAAKSIGVVIVGVADEVFVNRAQVVLIIAALLRDAIGAAPPGGRVAVTGQEIERELVFAIHDSGKRRAPSTRFDYFVTEAAHALGGRVWTAHPSEGNLSLFSVPLHGDAN